MTDREKIADAEKKINGWKTSIRHTKLHTITTMVAISDVYPTGVG